MTGHASGPSPRRPRAGDDALKALLQRAVALQRAGRTGAAARLYRKVLAARPGDAAALNGLAMVQLARGNATRAVALLEQLLDRVGPQPGLLMNLGAAHTAAAGFDSAERCYRHAIRLAPGYRDPYHNLGALCLKLGRPEQAVEVFDACLAAAGRDYHALAYRTHALIDAGRDQEAGEFLDYARFVRVWPFEAPSGYDSLSAFNTALAQHVRGHASLRANVMSTVKGRHTGELLEAPLGPVADLAPILERAVTWYADHLPEAPDHPIVQWAPHAWKLSCWGVVLSDAGHERSHIHPHGWLSGVLYVDLPDVISDPERRPEGWLRFGEPTPELNTRSAPHCHDVQPGYGRIVLFPAFYYHGTVPFYSDQPRVCISFDVRPLA